MRYIEAITSQFRKKESLTGQILTFEDHPLVKKAKSLTLICRIETGAGALGFGTWALNEYI